MSRFSRGLTFALLFEVGGSGCAHAFDPDPLQSQRVEHDASGFQGKKPPVGTSRVNVYRNRLLSVPHANAIPFSLFLDNKPLGDLQMDRYVDLLVTPGEHVLTGRMIGESNLPVTLTEGMILFVKLSNTASLELVDPGTGGRELDEDCQLGFQRDLSDRKPKPQPTAAPATTL